MKTLLLACFLTLTGLAHTQPRHAPAPLWERVLNAAPAPKPGQTSGISMLEVTPQCLIVSGGPGIGGLQALDAQTGKTLWQREGHWQRARDDDQEAGKVDNWSVVGVARGSQEETACLLKHTDQELTLNSTPNMDGVPKHLLSARYTLEAVSARTGQALWKSMAYGDKPKSWFDLHNGILTITHAGKGDEMRREYQDALTGKTLVLDTPEGRAQMRQILARNGGSILETQTTFQAASNAAPDWPLRWLRADTGTVETLPLPRLQGYIHADLIQPLTPQGPVVLRIDEDNDAVGHSQMPKYLVGADMQGHKVWQFPPQIKWRKGFEGEVAETQISPPTPIPGTGICLVRNGDLYGLRVRDGKPLWKKADFPLALTGEWFNGAFTQPAATYRSGCFAFAPRLGGKDNDTPVVAYVSAQTGSIQPLLFGVRVDQISVSGDTLIVQTAGNTFRAYSIPALLAASPKQSALSSLSTKTATPTPARFTGNLRTWKKVEFNAATAIVKYEGRTAHVFLSTGGKIGGGGIVSPPFSIVQGRTYRFAFDLRADTPTVLDGLDLISEYPDASNAYTCYAFVKLHATRKWQHMIVALRPTRSDARARLRISGAVSEEFTPNLCAAFWIRNVSLLPQSTTTPRSRKKWR